MLKLFPVMLIVLCLLLANCGGGKYCLNPQVVKNIINIKKDLVNNEVELKLDGQKTVITRSDMFEVKGYFKQYNKYVYITDTAETKIRCYDKDNNVLWTYPKDNKPYRTLTMSVYAGRHESFVILLEWLLKDNANEDLQSARILDEDGNTVNQFILPGLGSVYKYYFTDLSAHTIFGKTYLIGRGGDGIGIFDFDNGKLITYLYSKEAAPKDPEIIELVKNGKRYVVFYTDLRSYSKSSKIFILSDKWELLYEEVLESAFLRGKIAGTNDNFILTTLEIKDCKYTGNKITWKYTINP
jgi:hypothetical protein